jgi:hypothetical protein
VVTNKEGRYTTRSLMAHQKLTDCSTVVISGDTLADQEAGPGRHGAAAWRSLV